MIERGFPGSSVELVTLFLDKVHSDINVFARVIRQAVDL